MENDCVLWFLTNSLHSVQTFDVGVVQIIDDDDLLSLVDNKLNDGVGSDVAKASCDEDVFAILWLHFIFFILINYFRLFPLIPIKVCYGHVVIKFST